VVFDRFLFSLIFVVCFLLYLNIFGIATVFRGVIAFWTGEFDFAGVFACIFFSSAAVLRGVIAFWTGEFDFDGVFACIFFSSAVVFRGVIAFWPEDFDFAGVVACIFLTTLESFSFSLSTVLESNSWL
jgi:hypothetical protein